MFIVMLQLKSKNDASKIADAVKRYSYLLGQTELFKHFVDIKVSSCFQKKLYVFLIRSNSVQKTRNMQR